MNSGFRQIILKQITNNAGTASSRICREPHVLRNVIRAIKPQIVQGQTRNSSTGIALAPAPAIQTPTAIPSINQCPSPTCSCAAAPANLDIDWTSQLAGIPYYDTHIVIPTGRSDWQSNLEDETFYTDMKAALKPKGPKGQQQGNFYDADRTVMVSAADGSMSNGEGDVLVFPQFVRMRAVVKEGGKMVDKVLGQVLDIPVRSREISTTPIEQAVVLICGHGQRDERCGILGPLLQTEFRKSLERDAPLPNAQPPEVHLISHVGGHKFAGNVIVYIPRSWAHSSPRDDQTASGHALAGCGIWYGRVMPGDVEGIVRETVKQGRVIRNLLRGGMDPDGKPLVLSEAR